MAIFMAIFEEICEEALLEWQLFSESFAQTSLLMT